MPEILIADPDEWPLDLAYALENTDGHEEVAILLGTRSGDSLSIHAAYGVLNSAPDSRLHWAIRGEDYAEARKWGRANGGLAVVGHIHTHWHSPAPSEADYRSLRTRHAFRANLVGAVWSLDTAELIWYGREGELRRDSLPIPEAYQLAPADATIAGPGPARAEALAD